MACPVCRSDLFYIKDPEDSYETYDFQWLNGDIRFEDADNSIQLAEVTPVREVFCQKCAWHGPLQAIDGSI